MTVCIAFMVSVGMLMASQAYVGRLKRARTPVPDMEFCHLLHAV